MLKRKKERTTYFSTQSEEEKRKGIQRIDKKGSFYSHIETHPYEDIKDLKKGTNYYGSYVDNFYDHSYEIEFTATIDRWQVTVKLDQSRAHEITEGGKRCLRYLKAEIKRVPLKGSGRSYTLAHYEITSSRQKEITDAF